jgi:ubiquinone/menaquinone biosynthesis C-methylase UbiE
MNPNQALWEKGDFTRIAATMRESGEAIVAGLGITRGMKVLDLGCGDGTTALPAARKGADVLGVDIASNLVKAGNGRAQEEGLTNCRFQEGDATDLSELADQSFDLVIRRSRSRETRTPLGFPAHPLRLSLTSETTTGPR